MIVSNRPGIMIVTDSESVMMIILIPESYILPICGDGYGDIRNGNLNSVDMMMMVVMEKIVMI